MQRCALPDRLQVGARGKQADARRHYSHRGVSSADRKPDVQRKAGRVALGALDQGFTSEGAVRDGGLGWTLSARLPVKQETQDQQASANG